MPRRLLRDGRIVDDKIEPIEKLVDADRVVVVGVEVGDDYRIASIGSPDVLSARERPSRESRALAQARMRLLSAP